MVLGSEAIEKIKDAVRQRPRTINEIANDLDVSWKTADRYVESLKETDGCILTHTFRQGTRGAMKIAYWNIIEQSFTEAQEIIFSQIRQGKKKEDFSPLDVFQFADAKKRKMVVFEEGQEQEFFFKNFVELMESAKETVCMFSGNLSLVNYEFGEKTTMKILESLAKKGVSFKVISRVELPAIKNIEKMLSLNIKSGRNAVEIVHLEQPLRGFIVDGKIVGLKEVKNPLNYKKGELEKKTYIFYSFWDKKWVDWMQNVFWKLWQNSFDAKTRLESMKFLRKRR